MHVLWLVERSTQKDRTECSESECQRLEVWHRSTNIDFNYLVSTPLHDHVCFLNTARSMLQETGRNQVGRIGSKFLFKVWRYV